MFRKSEVGGRACGYPKITRPVEREARMLHACVDAYAAI